MGYKIALNEAGTRIGNGQSSYINNSSRGKVSIYDDGSVLSTINFEKSHLFKLYPNPNKGIFNISFTESQPRITVNIVDLLGRQIVTVDYFNTNTVAVDENLKAGVYLVEIYAEGISESVRIVVE
ncbi:T9SS type A sorting domain-containing protein [Rasiella sp. SM2506]|uniref:T9SS type A sorting domain-containing protein n=1 Tax=Rasiella sp. SM2506 TaxID=3423914 RepID=UPI003D7B2A88